MIDKVKELGQVMTPRNIVDYMIGILNLSNDEIQNATFIDNSCGDGEFIKGLLALGVPANHIYACDIDKEISQFITSLIPTNNFYLGSIFDKTEWIGKFDYVIGNPPYVRIHNIPEQQRAYLKTNFNFCFGMFDLYMAFYEFGLKLLKPTGTLLYISPNSFIRNACGRNMREYIQNNHLLWYFEDFEHETKFANYSTYTCIVGLSAAKNDIDCPWQQKRVLKGLSYESLQNGIATLLDSFFIHDDFSDLEQDFIHPILKASTGERKFVIVPPATEDEFKQAPKTYKYFLDNKERLLARSLTGNTKWFQFGRSQGLANMNKEKLAIATTVPFNGMRVYRLPADWYVYSGLYATANDLDKLEQELNSQDLLDYVIKNGKPMSGNYVQIGSTLLKHF